MAPPSAAPPVFTLPGVRNPHDMGFNLPGVQPPSYYFNGALRR